MENRKMIATAYRLRYRISMDILTTDTAGKELGISGARVRRLILDGRLPAIKLGKTWLIERKHLQKVAVRKPGRPKQIKKQLETNTEGSK